MSKKPLTAGEKIDLTRAIVTALNQLTEDGALAGIILTTRSFDQFKQELGFNAHPYRPAEIDIDPNMEHSFVVDKLLILRGTQLQ